nr:MAG TPA: hypothetical protein [Bacteriophage sp.]
MQQLQVVCTNGINVIDSRDIARTTSVRHSDLLEKINAYCDFLTNGKFRSLDFFIPSTYKDGKGETRPCYLLTKKGCDMVANKMTGEKGVLFTAAYVTAFEKMRETLAAPKPLSPAEQLLQQASVLVEQERRITALEEQTQKTSARITDVVSAFSVPVFTKDHWQEQANQIINRIVEVNHLNHQQYRHKLYEELERAANCNLEMRKKRMQSRMRNGGAKYADVIAVSKLAIIAADAKLRAIFEGILRREAALCIAG